MSKGGRGGLGQSKKSLSENTQIFLTKGGGLTQSKRVLSEKLRFFGIIYQKRGVFIKKTGIFFDYFAEKGGGLGQSKKSLSENTQIFFDQGGGVSPNPKGFYQKN